MVLSNILLSSLNGFIDKYVFTETIYKLKLKKKSNGYAEFEKKNNNPLFIYLFICDFQSLQDLAQFIN